MFLQRVTIRLRIVERLDAFKSARQAPVLQLGRNWACLMIKCYVIFEDDPQNEMVVEMGEGTPRAEWLAQFDSIVAAGEFDGREIRGMWMVDHASEQGEVLKTHGLVPIDIKNRS